MELKEGMYVRINGFISKIHYINTSKKGETYMQFIQPNGLNASMNVKFYDGKASHNIIDLIEKNDLVIDNYGNIYVVDYVFDNYVYTTTKQANITKTLCDYQIKSIVTKEQFESMKYEVK